MHPSPGEGGRTAAQLRLASEGGRGAKGNQLGAVPWAQAGEVAGRLPPIGDKQGPGAGGAGREGTAGTPRCGQGWGSLSRDPS